MGGVRQFLEFPGGRGVTASSLKWKIRRVGGVLYDLPCVVGVWIFSGTTHYDSKMPRYPHREAINTFQLHVLS